MYAYWKVQIIFRQNNQRYVSVWNNFCFIDTANVIWLHKNMFNFKLAMLVSIFKFSQPYSNYRIFIKYQWIYFKFNQSNSYENHQPVLIEIIATTRQFKIIICFWYIPWILPDIKKLFIFKQTLCLLNLVLFWTLLKLLITHFLFNFNTFASKLTRFILWALTLYGYATCFLISGKYLCLK